MVSLIFSDIDGTLINNDFVVTPRTQEAIRQAVSQGIPFVPVSARMPEAIQPIIDSIGIDSPIISYNGALVQTASGQVVSSNPMSSNVAVAICQYVQDHQDQVVWNVYSGSSWLSQNRSDYWIKREEKVVSVLSQEADLAQVGALSEVHKVLLMGDPKLVPDLERELKARYPDLSIAQSAPYFIEIMAQGISKSHAVKVLADYLHVPLADTIAFGDNYNDLAMLDTVGTGYVMGNAPADIQERFGNVTADNNHDGIAAVLETILS